MKASIIVREWIRAEYLEDEFNSLPSEIEEEKETEHEEEDQENTPVEQDDEDEGSDADDYMYANELEDHEVDG